MSERERQDDDPTAIFARLREVEIPAALLASVSLLFIVLLLWPVAALAVTSGCTLALNALIVLWTACVYAETMSRFYGSPRWHALLYPVAVVLVLWMVWRASLMTIRSGGVSWRGTRYNQND